MTKTEISAPVEMMTNGSPGPEPAATDVLDASLFLRVLSQVKTGDFTARLPLDWTGVAGKVADALNDIIAANQTLENELARVSRVVGREGRTFPAVGAWWARFRRGRNCTESVNNLIDDLVRPTSEMQRVIGAVADGDLSKKISVDVRGETLELKNTINAMVDRLTGFVSEVNRVAREVGTRGQVGPGRRGHRRGGRRLEGADRQRQRHGRQPHRPSAQHRRGDHGGGRRGPEQEDLRGRQGRVPRAQEHGQRHGRPAQQFRRGGHPRGPRGRRRGQARRVRPNPKRSAASGRTSPTTSTSWPPT